MTVRLDLEGSRGEQTANGWRFDRLCIVSGLTGSAAKRLVRATQTSGVPKLGSIYPGVANCRLKAIIPEGLGASNVRLRLIYEPEDKAEETLDLADVEIGSTLTSAQVSSDYRGTAITVTYTDADGIVHTQGAEVSAFLPNTTIVISQTENQSPGTKAKKYVGLVNAGGWKRDPAAHRWEWLCTGIIGRRNPDRKTYRVTYSFQYRKYDILTPGPMWDGWNARVRYILPQGENAGKPPADAYYKSPGRKNGITVWQIYDECNFDEMFPIA